MCTSFLFLSDGGLHAHCRRDRTYLFLSASISRTVHEQTGETMNDDVCVLLYSFTSFFLKQFSLYLHVLCPLLSWKVHFLVQKFVCAMFESHGSSHSLSCHYRAFFVVNSWPLQKNVCPPRLAKAQLRRLLLQAWFVWADHQAAALLACCSYKNESAMNTSDIRNTFRHA